MWNICERQLKRYRRNLFTGCLLCYRNETLFKRFVEALIDNEESNYALRLCTLPQNKWMLPNSFLGVFIDAIANKAREHLAAVDLFNITNFICSTCNNIISDPVTLKCGHTFSRKCLAAFTENEFFYCPECKIKYKKCYLNELKNNIIILNMTEKFFEKYNVNEKICIDRNYNSSPTFLLLEIAKPNDISSAVVLSVKTSEEYFQRGEILYRFGKTKDAFKQFMTSYVLDKKCRRSRTTAVQLFRQLLEENLRQLNFDHVKMKYYLKRKIDNAEKYDYADAPDLHQMLQEFFRDIKDFAYRKNVPSKVNDAFLEKRDLECSLCMRILWQPVTTTCGHTFCRSCLYRSFDHQPNCPLCKTALSSFLAERIENITTFLDRAVRELFPADYNERKELYLEEMERLSNAGKDPSHEIPLFICTVALPTMPCLLHVFEPRYRLMIRQCMESGSRQFGMCGVVDNEIADYGTMLEIRNVTYLHDGRSIVDTIGSKRFHIIRKGQKDGYDTAHINFLDDNDVIFERKSIAEKHTELREMCETWFANLSSSRKEQILQHFGPMPEIESSYLTLKDGPSWMWWILAILPVESRLKIYFVSLTCLKRRLDLLCRVLIHFQSYTI